MLCDQRPPTLAVTLPTDYPALLATLDSWQRSASERHPGVIPCTPGCAACCHGPFDISVADALLVRDTVAALPPPIRKALTRRATEQLDRMRAVEPALTAPFDLSRLGETRFDALVDAFEGEACPALDEDARCRIYQGRPMVCRMMGLGLLTDRGDVIDNACPIQDDFPAYQSLAPQPFDLTRWEVGEERAQAMAAEVLFGSNGETGFETTVAGAILLTTA